MLCPTRDKGNSETQIKSSYKENNAKGKTGALSA